MKQSKGFTLIELLIVVAIIAILAAIAVPNFLEAQTRAKVSRAKSDMRSLSVAVEAYAVDNNSYFYGIFVHDDPMWKWTYGYAPDQFTTPIAYITSHPIDPFNIGSFKIYNGANLNYPVGHAHTRYRYAPRVPYTGANTAWTQRAWDTYLWPLMTTQWKGDSNNFILVSVGPDKVEDVIPAYHPLTYDSTNGTVSPGDIVFASSGGSK
jgi:prepilin-type N-terminal cleavage/methylation domain-containing protein